MSPLRRRVDTEDLASHFRVVRSIADKRHTLVMLADDLVHARRVVLKLARDSASELERERDALRRIKHPNIVELVDAGYTSAGFPFLATTFHEGPTLEQVIA